MKKFLSIMIILVFYSCTPMKRYTIANIDELPDRPNPPYFKNL